MRYLLITLLLTLGSTILSAQDTLYVKGERKPLIVNITIVKKNSLNYTKIEGGLVRTIKMKDVKKIKFYKATEPISPTKEAISTASKARTYPPFDEFRSTISINSIGSFRFYGGLNYLYHLNNIKSQSEKLNLFINVGGGYYRRSIGFSLRTPEIFDQAKGYYLEFGLRAELHNQRNPKSRFHFGLDVNNRWVEKITNRLFESVVEVSNVSEFAVQIPLGYTFRSSDGFYFTTGLELTSEKVFPAAHVGLGIAFGK